MNKYKLHNLILSLVICVSLLLTMSLPAFAASGLSLFSKAPEPTKVLNKKLLGDDINYVVFGDSQTDGYYLPDYFARDKKGGLVSYEDGTLISARGFNTYVSGTYYDLFAQYLAKKTGKQVNVYAYAGDAMRYEDLHKLFDSSVTVDGFYRQYFDGSPTRPGETELETSDNYFEDFFLDKDNKPVGTYERISKSVRAAAKEADIISISLGTNTFANWLANRFADLLVSNGTSKYGEVDKTKYLGLTKLQKALFDMYYEKAMSAVRNMAGDKKDVVEKIEGIIWDIVYAFTAYSAGIKDCLEHIEKLNPDVTVILLGVPNVAEGFVVNLYGVNIDLGKIERLLGEVTDAQLEAACEESGLKTLCVSMGTYDRIIKDIAAMSKDRVDFTSVNENLMGKYVKNVMDNFGKEIFGDDIFNAMMKQTTKAKKTERVSALNRQSIETGVKSVLGNSCVTSGLTAFPSPQIRDSGEVAVSGGEVVYDDVIGNIYLGIRDAIIESCKTVKAYEFENTLRCYTKPAEVAAQLQDDYIERTETDLRTKVYNLLMAQPGMKDYLSLCVRFIVHSAGSHFNYDGHSGVAGDLICEYDKFVLKNKVNRVIKNAIPVVVAGVVVTYVAKDVGETLFKRMIAAELLAHTQDKMLQRWSSLFGVKKPCMIN